MSTQDMEGLPQPTAASLEAENSTASCSGDESLFGKHYSEGYMKDGASTSLSNSIEEPESVMSHSVRLKDDKSKEGSDLGAENNELNAVSSKNKDERLKEGENAGSEDLPLEDPVAQDLQDQDDELRALGINVVDQLSLERNVEAAVDKAVMMHARKQKLQILKKETNDIKKEIKLAENKLQNLKNRRSGMQQRVVDPRMFFKVEEDIKSEAQQLQVLRSRETLMQQKLTSAEFNEEELDKFDLEEGEIVEEEDDSQGERVMLESERERLIREGQMTPFGTISTASKTVSFPRPPETHVKKPVPAGRTKTTTRNVLNKEEMISSGEMTPFGTIMKTADTATKISKGSIDTAGGVSDFEKYLQDQISRQQQHSKSGKSIKKATGNSIYGVPKKRPKKLKEYIGNSDCEDLGIGNDGGKSSSVSSVKKKAKGNDKRIAKPQGKSPLKKNILCPKKKKAKVALGTVVSTLESDQLKCPPRRLLSERVSLEESDPEGYSDQGSDDEYVPSDTESLDLEDEGEGECEGERLTLEERRGGYMKVKGEKSKKRKKEEIEGELSDDDVPRVKRKKVKSRDDGNLSDYVKRIEAWKKERLKKKQEKILRGEDFDSEEEEEEGYEQFLGGYKVPLLIWNKLYKYQRTCVRWLWELHSQGCGGILGDEMGLGKTIQIISFLVGLSYSRLTYRRQQWQGLGPVLVVCPATVLHQWVKEFHKWWPPFRVAVMHESGSFTGKKPALINNINSYCGILVTSYTGVRDQLEILLQYDWHYIILDEGHKIRNPEAQITVALKRFQTPHRLILSGSPIQNNLKELWSLFDFVFPGKLGTLPVFLQQFAVPITQGGYSNATKLEVQTAFKCASMLRDTINPFLLRRMKHDVRSHLTLPDKNEQVLFCDLSDEQRKVYVEYISGRQVQAIMGGRAKVFVGLINLRKICNHPDLFTGGPHGLDDAWDSGLQPELKYGWWARSGKMHVLHSILALWCRQGHRVLLFTQSRQMMCILEKFLLEEQYSYLKMDGTTTVSSRQPMIEKFNNDPTYFVFLLTTRVGGLGVNLTGADRVVIFDPDWNPSTDSQARERAWRIGQLRHVTIYRLLTAGTIEEKIYHRQIFKQFLTNRVLKDPKQQRFFKTNDLYELFSLTEGEKEKTESSAIFAGTGSEIKLGVKKKECSEQGTFTANDSGGSGVAGQQNAGITKKQMSVKTYSNKSPLQRDKGRRDKLGCKPIDKKEKENSPVISTSQVEKMKELAKLLSQKIGNKKKPQEESEASTEVIKEEDKDTNNDNKIGSDSFDNSCVGKLQEEMDIKIEIKEEPTDVEMNLMGTKEIVAVELSAVNEPLSTVKGENDTVTSQVETVPGNGGTNVEGEDEQNSEGKENILYKLLSHGSDNRRDENRISSGYQSNVIKKNDDSKSPEQVVKHKNTHKKKEKDRNREKNSDRRRKKGKKFEGERVAYLVKKRTYQKTEEEEKAERENSKSQDQYVLEKLFRKSGVHTALSHDAIMNNSDPDYLLMEGEAERVAKEALKAVRASRSRCFRPQLADATTKSPGKSMPKFGRKKNLVFTDAISGRDTEVKEKSHKEKKVHMFNGGMEEEEEEEEEDNNNEKSECEGNKAVTSVKIGQGSAGGSSGMLSSSQLLLRMRQRNKGLTLDSGEEDEEGYDPDYPSTAPIEAETVEPEVQENIDLLADIRNFVAFQAEVDGQATTQEIIARFQQRLPPSQTPFFKALLTQICDFHRDTAGKGVWSLKGEFR